MRAKGSRKKMIRAWVVFNGETICLSGCHYHIYDSKGQAEYVRNFGDSKISSRGYEVFEVEIRPLPKRTRK